MWVWGRGICWGCESVGSGEEDEVCEDWGIGRTRRVYEGGLGIATLLPTRNTHHDYIHTRSYKRTQDAVPHYTRSPLQ